MNKLLARSQARLAAIAQNGRRRQRREIVAWDGIRAETAAGERARVFCGNDYLGLSQDPRLVAAQREALARYGAGSTASQHVCGYSSEQAQLEQELAQALAVERVLVGGSGYAMNSGALAVLATEADTIFSDALNHASLIDGCRLSRAQVQRYPHLDLGRLDKLLAASEADLNWVVSDAMFSMDGDCAPLPELLALARRHEALVYLDDAHGFGWAGEGRGHLAGLETDARVVQMVTFGKALGSYGAAIGGAADVIETLVQDQRTTMFATALPPAQCAATRAALRICQTEPQHRQQLQANIAQFEKLVAEAGLDTLPASGPIQALILGAEDRALWWANELWRRGFWINAIRPPTVPAGTARLRITLSAAHQPADVEALVAALAEIGGTERRTKH